jgi:hypothetical protein
MPHKCGDEDWLKTAFPSPRTRSVHALFKRIFLLQCLIDRLILQSDLTDTSPCDE